MIFCYLPTCSGCRPGCYGDIPATSQYVRQNDLSVCSSIKELPCFLLQYPSTNSIQDQLNPDAASWRSIH